MKKNLPVIVLVLVTVIIIGSIAYLESKKSSKGTFVSNGEKIVVDLDSNSRLEAKAKQYDTAQEIVSPAGFINTNGEEIKIKDLIGKKVILVDFWTYSCINCQRTLPYITSWYEKYKNQGLEIVGIHTPEFEFEKDINNVKAAVEKWGIDYPVVLDNDYGTWRNYNNRYWPRKYIIDIDGFIVYDHIGEGGYEETEQVIQTLLKERMQVLDEEGEVSSGVVYPEGVEELDTQNSRSPETYFGALRNINLGSGEKGRVGTQDFSLPLSTVRDVLYLDGRWDVQGEYAKNLEAGTKIVFKYKAAKVFMVASADEEVGLEILVDGEEVGDLAGSDVVDGVVNVKNDQLYRLIEDPTGNAVHTLEIIVTKPGLQAFTFTFG